MSLKHYQISAEQVEKNYNTFVKLCSTLGDRTEAINNLITHFGERLIMCPASSKAHYHNCFVGGLVDHCLRVLSFALKLTKLYNLDLSRESLILSCLFHDVGKLGDLTSDFYLQQTSSWHAERGELYEYNKKLQHMQTTHRSMWLLQQFNVKLTQDEYLAILLCDGLSSEEMKSYTLQEPMLATIVHQADYMATVQEKKMYDEFMNSAADNGDAK